MLSSKISVRIRLIKSRGFSKSGEHPFENPIIAAWRILMPRCVCLSFFWRTFGLTDREAPGQSVPQPRNSWIQKSDLRRRRVVESRR